MKLRQSLTTRQGRKVPRMLYEQRGEQPADDDPIIGLVDTPELAALIVAAVNAYTDGLAIDPTLGGKLHDVHGGPGQDCWCGYVGHEP